MRNKIILILVFVFIANISLFSQSITNPDTVCAGSNVYYKIPNPRANSTFTWGIYNSQGTITYGAGTDSIRIDWNNTAGMDSLWVFETNAATCKGDTAKLKVIRVAPPTAEFVNSTLCYGENLQINFTGYPPFSVEYTLDVNTLVQNEITQNQYPVGGTSGSYELIQVSNKYCGTGTLSGTTHAIIGSQLQPLQITHE